jgi:hypothetical protein
MPLPLPLKVINVVSSASRALPLLAQFRTYRCVAPLADQLADPRRGAARGGELRQAAGAVASVATDKRGVTRSQTHIHDGPRNARLDPNSRRVMGHHRTHACSRVDDEKQCEPHQLH